MEETTGTGQTRPAAKGGGVQKAIIAAGSQAVRPPFMPDDPRVVDSTGALACRACPKMLIVGGGIIGLEMGTVYSTLGARLDVVEMMDGLMQGADRDLVKVWEKMNKHRFDNIRLKTKTVGARATPEGIKVQFEGLDGTKSEGTYDLVLQAVGRTPNGKKIAADKAGVAVTDRGFINVDIQMRTNVPHIFAIGDIVGQPCWRTRRCMRRMWQPEVIAGELQGNKELASAAFNARVIPSVAYRPRSGLGGPDRRPGQAAGHQGQEGLFPWTASGRAIANGATKASPSCCSTTAPKQDQETHAGHHGKILGGGMVGTHAGDMIGEIAPAIEMGATPWTSARPSTRIRRWARASAWRRKWRMAAARMCRRRANKSAAVTRQGPNWRRFGPCALRTQTIAAEYCAFVQYSCQSLQAKLYNPRHPERTPLYQTVAEHYETWLELASAGQFDGQGDHHTPKPFVRKSVCHISGVRHQ